MKIVQYQNYQCVQLSNQTLTLLVTQSVGPRILSLRVKGGENLFAELPNKVLDRSDGRTYRFYGGHRLWHAPEDVNRTYLPDNEPVEISPLERGCRVVQPVEPETGLQKTIEIQLSPKQAVVEVEHILTNRGAKPTPCALWAITQFKPGGVALLPQNTGLMNGNPTLPNRTLAFWPYTDIKNPHLTLKNDAIIIEAKFEDGALKVGFPNPRGWLAYWQEGVLFVKRAVCHSSAEYYDFGSSSECYCAPDVLELETLGPKVTLQPGESAAHKETWEIYTNFEWNDDLAETMAFIENRLFGNSRGVQHARAGWPHPAGGVRGSGLPLRAKTNV
ncbi:MAG: hypothetical protein U9O54_04130 [Chloroflexota bacterium]|nr:hypothetical protein [Chloroflexota bacterium]